MIIELHLLQNFAPSNLNRDDTGAPKDCEFGGFRRARISSQCLKRAIREHFRTSGLLGADQLAVRTKRLADEVAGRLAEAGEDREQAGRVAETALSGVGLKVAPPPGRPDERLTQYLVFAGEAEVAAIARTCLDHWDALLQASGGAEEKGASSPRAGRDAKRAAKASVPKEATVAIEAALDGGRAADLALFGRMLADLPQRNIHAASQVAHALSTNKVSVEFDFYTAVDDLRPEDTTGADMMGTVEFNSACFYRYANVDVRQLQENLGGDASLARRTVDAFIRASVEAIPTGKQNSMAAQNPPSFVFAVVRDTGCWSLANAFVRPVAPDQNGDLVENSVRALDAYWGQLVDMYGAVGIRGAYVVALAGNGLQRLAEHNHGTVSALVDGVVGAAFATVS